MDLGPNRLFFLIAQSDSPRREAAATNLNLNVGIGIEVVAPPRVALLAHRACDHEEISTVFQAGQVNRTRLSRFSSGNRERQHGHAGCAHGCKATIARPEKPGIQARSDIPDDPGYPRRSREPDDETLGHALRLIENDDLARRFALAHAVKSFVDLGQLDSGRNHFVQVQTTIQVKIDVLGHIETEAIGTHE